MRFFEFITHPDRFVQHNPNNPNSLSTTQKKQFWDWPWTTETTKQLILTDSKNILTSRFQPIQRLQPNFKTDGIRKFIYTKHNGDNAKLRIFSFIPQRQSIKPNFMNSNQTTKQTNTTRKTKTTTSMWVSPLTQSLYSYNWDNANSGVLTINFAISSP